MNHSTTLAAVFVLMAVPLASPAHEFPVFDEGVRECYGRAMIGFDSVINARLGIPPEHALKLAQLTDVTPITGAEYRDDILIVMWGAYLWTNTPHNYAINVFYRCAREQDRATQADISG